MNEQIKPLDAAQSATVTRPEAPPPGPCAMVIFGAGGDLTKRLVTPALYNLCCTHLLPDNFAILGVDHNPQSDESWRNNLTQMMQSFVGGTGEFDPSRIDQKSWAWLTERMSYVQGDFEDSKTYDAIRDRLAGFEHDRGTGGNVLFYLAVSDRFFGTVVDELGKAGLVTSKAEDAKAPWRRVVIEKPFGHDLPRPRT